jgi:hypothetical protein
MRRRCEQWQALLLNRSAAASSGSLPEQPLLPRAAAIGLAVRDL